MLVQAPAFHTLHSAIIIIIIIIGQDSCNLGPLNVVAVAHGGFGHTPSPFFPKRLIQHDRIKLVQHNV